MAITLTGCWSGKDYIDAIGGDTYKLVKLKEISTTDGKISGNFLGLSGNIKTEPSILIALKDNDNSIFTLLIPLSKARLIYITDNAIPHITIIPSTAKFSTFLYSDYSAERAKQILTKSEIIKYAYKEIIIYVQENSQSDYIKYW